MSRKREKPYLSRHVPYSFPKRRRPLDPDAGEEASFQSSVTAASKPQTTVVVIGLPASCSVLDLKSRFEIYGAISRTRMDPNGLAYVTFRSHDSAQSAVAAAVDAAFPITVSSKEVQVMWASDPVPQWKEGVARKDGTPAVSSKLVRAELPLRRHGRGNRLGSAIVKPKDENNGKADANDSTDDTRVGSVDPDLGPGLDGSFKGREIVVYDDIL